MSAIRTQIRENVVAALRAIVGLRPEDGVYVVSVAAPSDALYLPGERVLAVCRLGGDVANDGDSPLFAHGSQMRRLTFALVLKVDCPLDSAEALTMDDGAEALMETACQSIQRTDVGTATTGPVYLEASKEEVLVHPNRVSGEGGGPVALVHTFTTTEFEL